MLILEVTAWGLLLLLIFVLSVFFLFLAIMAITNIHYTLTETPKKKEGKITSLIGSVCLFLASISLLICFTIFANAVMDVILML